jgi:hypothetical protein
VEPKNEGEALYLCGTKNSLGEIYEIAHAHDSCRWGFGDFAGGCFRPNYAWNKTEAASSLLDQVGGERAE